MDEINEIILKEGHQVEYTELTNGHPDQEDSQSINLGTIGKMYQETETTMTALTDKGFQIRVTIKPDTLSDSVITKTMA